ncbi:MAG: hypothetical protein IJA81_02690 [Akkermansia sp.]|nr:hypothetical protein [Akkermansia sp.]
MPEFDEDGNQLYIQTETANWALNYNAANRPTDFSCMDEEGNFLTVKCDYDFMGRRVFKKVIRGNSTVTSHQRFIYRGYLQIACVDLTRTNHPCLWLITWDPTQPIATRPLANQKDGTWYTYGLDLTKNVCEVFGSSGYIGTAYTYTPFGEVTASGNVDQPIQWSSEYHDAETDLVYYNYRYYNQEVNRWIIRDFYFGKHKLYIGINNSPAITIDILGLNEDDKYWSPTGNAPMPKLTNYKDVIKIYSISGVGDSIVSFFKFDAINVKNPDEFKNVMNQKIKDCIDNLIIYAHGEHKEKGLVVMHIGNIPFFEGQEHTEITDLLGSYTYCKGCKIKLVVCNLGKSPYLKKRLEQRTGCYVKLYAYTVNSLIQ